MQITQICLENLRNPHNLQALLIELKKNLRIKHSKYSRNPVIDIAEFFIKICAICTICEMFYPLIYGRKKNPYISS